MCAEDCEPDNFAKSLLICVDRLKLDLTFSAW